MRTIRLSKERHELSVVNNLTGKPSNAHDLAWAVIKIIESGINAFGIYLFSNQRQATCYGFAKKYLK